MSATHKFAIGTKLRFVNAGVPFKNGDIVTVTRHITSPNGYQRYAVNNNTNSGVGWNETRFELVSAPEPATREPARKFKAGDRVRALRKIFYPLVEAGDTRVVSGYNAFGNLTLEGTGDCGFYDADFALVPAAPVKLAEPELNAGDKVRALRDTTDITAGNVYTVKNVDTGWVVITADDVGDANGLLRVDEYELVTAAAPTTVYKVIPVISDALEWSDDFASIAAAQEAVTARGATGVEFEIYSTARTVHKRVKVQETCTRSLVTL